MLPEGSDGTDRREPQMSRWRAQIATEAIDLGAAMAQVTSPAHGAVASFVGQVRDHDPEASGEVVSLDYSAHPDAGRTIERVVAQTLESLDPTGQTDGVALHRVGHLEVGDLALVVVVGSAHRALAFEVCRGVVEAVKHEVPIWKKQHTADGAHVWSGLDQQAVGDGGR
ncbi:hypothetical protein GCM10022199_15470 [Marihabitans asiaticum]|uniref:Molybdopterin synthase subunit MoaE n=2 Tax=Marihabitans asiaticum TaxID=415218 RepID=A0A560W808_9MICO|nr:molybdopterin synthase subunit MoaE [Marihabitans asiaticum]